MFRRGDWQRDTVDLRRALAETRDDPPQEQFRPQEQFSQHRDTDAHRQETVERGQPADDWIGDGDMRAFGVSAS